MYKDRMLSEEEIEAMVKRIDGGMAQENMPLTDEIKNNIRKCLAGETTTEEECQRIIDKYTNS